MTDTNKFKVSATIPTSSRVKSIVTFKVDGSPFIAYGCNKSYEINVWNLVNYQLDYSLKGHTGNINALKNYERNGNTFIIRSIWMDKNLDKMKILAIEISNRLGKVMVHYDHIHDI